MPVGKNNRYGHPNKEVFDNLAKSKIYRTDIEGSIMFKDEKVSPLATQSTWSHYSELLSIKDINKYITIYYFQ